MIRPHLRVLHCSDFHFDVQFREHALNVIRQLAAMQRALDYDVVLIAGDVFDSTRQPTDFVDDVAEIFLDFQVPIIAIPGNHDVVYDHRDPASQLFSLIKERSTYLSSADGRTVVAADGRLRVWGRGMPEHSPENDPLANLETMAADALWNVVLAHGELMTSRQGAMLSSPAVLKDHDQALSSVHYIALGHYHYPTQTTYGRTVVRYSGSASSIVGTGTVTLVDFSNEEGLSISSHPTKE